MDVHKLIRELLEERDRVNEAIAKLEGLATRAPLATPRRRGRKSMSSSERAEVAERMKKYWTAWRKKKKNGR